MICGFILLILWVCGGWVLGVVLCVIWCCWRWCVGVWCVSCIVLDWWHIKRIPNSSWFTRSNPSRHSKPNHFHNFLHSPTNKKIKYCELRTELIWWCVHSPYSIHAHSSTFSCFDQSTEQRPISHVVGPLFLPGKGIHFFCTNSEIDNYNRLLRLRCVGVGEWYR